MGEERAKRKLAAILSADVKGYSRLMADDEEATVRTINAYREVMTDLIQRHNGRIVDAKGDNVLAEFPSVVDAVRCAVDVQKELKVRNADLSENRKMEWRIGINLGDVIEEGDTIYGDGVNIAARIEGLAEGSGICISRKAFDEVKNRISLGYEYLGEHSVKNIAEPVRVYKVLMEPEHAGKVIEETKTKPKRRRLTALAAILVLLVVGVFALWNFYQKPDVEPASKEKMAFPLPDRPSIAVLPFENMSGDTEHEYLADGMTESIISALSKIREMFVIARNSSFTYKGKPVKVQQVAEELGVLYVLEGSLQKAGDRLRITAQLVDALKGDHIWSEKYDREMKDLFAIQDDIALKIAIAMQIELTEGEQARVRHSTNNIEAWSLAVKAHHLFETYRRDDNAKAREFFKKAVELDPNYVYAWTYLGWTYWIDGRWYSMYYNPVKCFQSAEETAQKALSIDANSSDALALLSGVYLAQRKYDEAVSTGKKCIALDPNSSENHAIIAITMQNVGDGDAVIALIKQAMRLDPYFPPWYWFKLGIGYRMVGRYEESVKALKKRIEISEKAKKPVYPIYLELATTYSMMDRAEEAKTLVAKALEINPKINCKSWGKAFMYKNPAQTKRILEALRKAGLTDEPPLPLPDKPSIAVLAFVNMSDDPKQEYFSDGMSEDLITDLSKISGLFVIARNSSFAYKGKAVKISRIAEELGVRYVLEGSVRKAGDQVRINAQLIDATSGHHLWAERYDGKMQNIFTLQDKITRKIISALAVKLSVGERKHVESLETESIEAYDALLKGYGYYFRGTVDDAVMAISYFEKAIELDQNYGRAYAALAKTYFWGPKIGREWYAKIGLNYQKSVLRARHYLQMANKRPTSTSHQIASLMALKRRQYKKAMAEAELALSLEPNGIESNFNMGYVLLYLGRAKEGIGYLKRSIELDPLHPGWALFYMGLARFSMGQFAETVELINRALTYNPKTHKMSGILAAAYAHLGRDEEARDTLQNYLRGFEQRPDLNGIMSNWPFKDPKVSDRLAEGLIKAGLPGQASDYCRVLKENKLTGEEIRKLLFGRTRKGLIFGREEWQWSVICTKDGKFEYMDPDFYDTGKSWIEGDSLFVQYETRFEGRELSGEVYRNPEGTPKRMNEYFFIWDYGIIPFFVEG